MKPKFSNIRSSRLSLANSKRITVNSSSKRAGGTLRMDEIVLMKYIVYPSIEAYIYPIFLLIRINRYNCKSDVRIIG